MYANKNKDKNSKSRTVATGADSTRLSSKDSRYDAGDYEAVPESIRKIRDARNRELEEKNALPAEEIIARQEAEIEELKRQAEAANMTNKYKSVLDDDEEHPTFKNPDSMADFGDYEAVASSAMFEASKRDPNQKVFRAKPSVATRKVAKPSELTPGDYEAVAASARHAVPPDEFVPETYDDDENADTAASQDSDSGYMTDAEAARASREMPSRDVPEYTAPYSEPADDDTIHSEPYTPPAAAAPSASSSDDVIHSEPYTPPKPAPAPVSADDYTIQNNTAPAPEPTPVPAPAPVSAADYTVQNYTAPAPAPVSAADYTTQNYSAPASSAPSNDNAVHREPYTPPAASSYSSPSSYSAQSYVPPAQRNKYSDDGNYDVGGGPVYSPTSGRRIANFDDMAPGDYEAVADSSYDDSEMDLADGSYDFDKYLAGAPSLQAQAPAPSPEESDWADLGTTIEDIDDVDITDEQTRALTEAIAQETLSNQPGTQFEDIIDNVIAKVLERKKAEDDAKAAAQQQTEQQPEQQEQQQAQQVQQPSEQPEQRNPVQEQQTPQNPAAPQPEQPPVQNTAQPEQQQNPAPEQAQQPAQEDQGTQPKNTSLTPGVIDPSTPLEDIPAMIMAELDSAGDVSDDDIRKSIDAALIGKLTTGELDLDSVQSIRNNILDEVHEMQEEEARILAQLEGKPVKHPFDPDFLPADIAVEDIPDAVIAELDNIEGEVSDDEVKKSIDKVMIAKLSKGDLTLDSFQEARNTIFDTLGIETTEKQAEEAQTEPEPEPVKKAEPEPTEETEPEPTEEPEPEPTEETEPEPTEETEPEQEVESIEAEPEPVEETEPEPAEETEPEPAEETEPEPAEEVEPEPAEEPEEELNGPDLELSEDVEESVNGPLDENNEEPVDIVEEPVEEAALTDAEPDVQEDDKLVSESEHAPEQAPASEDEDEEEEQTTPIPVPKEPTVLEYDPYSDVFVNPTDDFDKTSESEETVEPEETNSSVETIEPEEAADSDEIVEPEGTDDSEEAVESDESDDSTEVAESEELLESPLSAAAVIAMQDQLEEKSGESDDQSDSEPEEESEGQVESEIVAEPEELEEQPESEVDAAPEESEEQPESKENVTAEEKESEEHDSVIDKQITFDDIFRNPFVNDFEPLEPGENSGEVESTEEAQESEPEAEGETIVEETPESEPEAEDETAVEEIQESEPEAEDENTVEDTQDAEPEAEPETAAEEIQDAESDVEAEPEPDIAIEDESVESPIDKAETDQENAEETESEPDEYAEAKAKRHDDMQSALLMAMIDDKEKTFSDAVNYMIDQDELNARTLRSRMPIDRDILDRVIKEHDFIPDKKTAIAICFALRLTWEDSVRLLYKAGYSLNDTERYDLTIEYLMRRGVYDQNMINSVLLGSGLEGFGTPQSEI